MEHLTALSVARVFPDAATAPGRCRHREQVAQQRVTWGSLVAPPSGCRVVLIAPRGTSGKAAEAGPVPRPAHLQLFVLSRGWRLTDPARSLGESGPGLRPGSAPGPERPWTGSSAQASSSLWRKPPASPRRLMQVGQRAWDQPLPLGRVCRGVALIMVILGCMKIFFNWVKFILLF